jgi:hypothetical protein
MVLDPRPANGEKDTWNCFLHLRGGSEPSHVTIIKDKDGESWYSRSLRPAQYQKPRMNDDNGSYGLVDTGSMKLLVTCRHVWEGFQSYRKKAYIFRCLSAPIRENLSFR